MTFEGRRDAAFLAAPGHDGGVRAEAAFEDLVPSDELAAILGEYLLGPADGIALQLLLGGELFIGYQPLGLDPCLAVWTFRPAGLRALVATDVDVLGGEKGCDFGDDGVHESEHRLLSRTVNEVGSAPIGEITDRFHRAGKLWIRTDSGHRVTGHLNFGDNGNEAFGGIGNHLADLLLSVVTSMGAALELAAPGTDLGQAGVFLDFDAPALIVGKMPVHRIDLVLREDIDLFLDLLNAEKMPAGIYMKATPRKAGIIHNLDIRDRSVRADQLVERLPGIEKARLGRGFGLDAFGVHGQDITFL